MLDLSKIIFHENLRYSAILFLIVLLPFDIGPQRLVFFTILGIITACLLLLWILNGYRRRLLQLRITTLMVLFAGFVGITLLSNLWTINAFATQYKSLTYLSIFGLFFLTTQESFPEKLYATLIYFLGVYLMILSLYGLYQYFILPQSKYYIQEIIIRRGQAVFVWPNTFAGYIILIWPVLLIQFCVERRRLYRNLLFISLLLAYTALLTTYSRGGWIAFLIALAVLMLLTGRQFLKKQIKNMILVITVCLGITIYFFLLPEAFISERVSSITAIPTQGLERFTIWKHTLDLAREHPLLGTGFRTFHITNTAWLPYGIRFDFAHNDYLQFFLELGLLGLAVFLLLLGRLYRLFWVFRSALKSRTRSKEDLISAGFMAGITATFVHSCVDYDLYIPGILIVLWIFVAFTSNYIEDNYAKSRIRTWPVHFTGKMVGSTSRYALTLILFGVFLFAVASPGLSKLAEKTGDQCSGEQRLDEAQQWYRIASTISPRDGNYNLKLGSLYSEKASLENNLVMRWVWLNSARREFVKAIENNPYSWSVFKSLALFYDTHIKLLTTSYGIPVERLKKIDSSIPGAGDMWLTIPDMYSYYRRSIDLYPNHRDLWLDLARAYLRYDDLDSALAWHERYLSADPDDLSALTSFGEALIRTQDYSRALEKLETVVAVDTTNSYAWFLLGKANLGLKNIQQARRQFDKSVEAAENKEYVSAIIQELMSRTIE